MVARAADIMGLEPRVDATPVPGASLGSVGDCTKRIAITGSSKVRWRDGLRRLIEHRHPDRIV
jgi:hypothetical protein